MEYVQNQKARVESNSDPLSKPLPFLLSKFIRIDPDMAIMACMNYLTNRNTFDGYMTDEAVA